MTRADLLRSAFALATAVLLLSAAHPAAAQSSDPNAAAQETSSPEPPPVPSRASDASSAAELSGAVDRFATYDAFGERDPRASRWNPYQQNPLKGDLPVFGDRGFLEIFTRLNSNGKYRRNPGVMQEGDDFEKTNLLAGFEVKMDEDTFHPSPLRFRLLGNFQVTSGGTGDTIQDGALQEAVVDVSLFDVGGDFNLSFFEAGVRPFRSDLNGLILNDVVGVARVFGEFRKNLWKYSAAFVRTLPKDPQSNLVSFDNNLDDTEQIVGALTVVRDDLVPGWNGEFSFHLNRDKRGVVLVDTGGAAFDQDADLDVAYVGVAFSGHLGRFIVQPALYLATGTDDLNSLTFDPNTLDPNSPSFNPDAIEEAKEDVQAWAAVVDLRLPADFVTWRLGALYASGDADPNDRKAEGFDSISDSVNIFGGPASFFVGEKIAAGGRTLVNANSALPSLRDSGRSNFVNPGAMVLNVGADVVLRPNLTAALNFNHISFVDTSSLSRATGVTGIDKQAGVEASVALRWRPLLNENLVVEAGGVRLVPGDALEAILGGDDPATAVFLNVLAVY